MTLKIEAGRFYRTRDGRKVGPMVHNGFGAEYWTAPSGQIEEAQSAWFECGSYWPIGHANRNHITVGRDLIAEWTDEPAATPEVGTPDVAKAMHEAIFGAPEQSLPYGHARLPSGEVVDLTAIEKPFGLLPPDVQQALRDHGGPWEIVRKNGWDEKLFDTFGDEYTYRVRPQPPEPKVEEVVVKGFVDHGKWYSGNKVPWQNYRITFNLINGKPDTSSIRMEAL